MAAPSELSQEAILNFMLAHGGRVTNHDLVKHFKKILTDPETRDAARNSFKEYVNTIATIRNEQDEKYLVLKKKYRQAGSSIGSMDSAPVSPAPGMDRPAASPPPEEPQSPSRQPPPYRPPPEPTPPASPRSAPQPAGEESWEGQPTPPVPPRRKSSDKLRAENKENVPESGRRPRTIGAESGLDEDGNESEKEEEQILSVKEQMKKFNRLASENESLQNFMTKKAVDKDVDDDDNVSVTSVSVSLDTKGREWLVRASQADYQALAKLASDNPRLAKLKVPIPVQPPRSQLWQLTTPDRL
ncbi:ankyrin repeat domain-containing protein SOWAHB [Bacillus rossius redtenbacheri]|uniref:ankyrin repeat domain-containing protein SOWAHB n=1 Tax=Bacillus rossius redtenbacheri TaxID=93214 RepID=UPI002FDEED0F